MSIKRENFTGERNFDEGANTLPIVISIGIVMLCMLFIILNKSMQPDEPESLAAASLIFDGHVPYKDFWQIHTPLFYYLFAPLCFFFKSMKIIYAARAITFCALLLNGYFVYFIIKLFLSKKAALLGVLSYFVCLPVLNMEVRSDVLVALFSNLSLLFLLWPRLAWGASFFLCGLSAALAVLSKQSGLFCVLSVVLLFIFGKFFPKERFNFRNFCFFMTGLLLPCGIFYLILAHQGAWDAFLKCAVKNDFLNSFLFLKVESVRSYPTPYLREMFLWDSPVLLSAAALFFCLFYYRKQLDTKKHNAFVIVLVFFAVSFGSLFMILHPWQWDLLLASQYLVLLAVPLLLFVYERALIFLLLFLCLPPLFHTFKTARFDLPGSIKMHDKIISLTNKNDKCFSIRPIPFRPSVYFYHIGTVLVEGPETRARVEKTLINEILNGNVVVIVPSPRYRGMGNLVSLIKDNYIMYDKTFDVPGRILDAGISGTDIFDTLVEGYYQVNVRGQEVYLDGKTAKGGVLYLKKGKHNITFPEYQGIGRRHCLITYDLQANKRVE